MILQEYLPIAIEFIVLGAKGGGKKSNAGTHVKVSFFRVTIVKTSKRKCPGTCWYELSQVTFQQLIVFPVYLHTPSTLF